MLKFTTCVLVIVVLWGSATSEEEEVDGAVGYCNYKGLQIKEGETVPAPIGTCQKITCRNAENNSLSALTCAKWNLAPDSKCHMSQKDLTKPYPACCPHKICDEE